MSHAYVQQRTKLDSEQLFQSKLLLMRLLMHSLCCVLILTLCFEFICNATG